jgi:2,3-bisphosphoglycerate-dependent phosphoglycerate mutase
MLIEAAAIPDLVATSPLLRAEQTVDLILEALGRRGYEPPHLVCPELTERAYGALTGLSKASVGAVFGADRAHRWRRSVTDRPPRLTDLSVDAFGVGAEPTVGPEDLYADVPPQALAAAEMSESLVDVLLRVRSWYQSVLLPRLRSGSVLVVAHGNSLRALVTILDSLDAEETERLNIPTGEPLLYAVHCGEPVPRSGSYLDPTTANAAALDVANEGGT